MSNLKSAKAAVLAELDHAREGLNYYTSRVEALEKAIASLGSLDADGLTGVQRPAKRVATPKTEKVVPTKQAKAKLPATGKDFWTGLIASEPKSARQILDAAIEALKIIPSKDDLKKLAQRQANALHMLVKAKVISDTGSGRDRRYSR